MNIKSLAHVCLKTTDLETTTVFYCGALGLEKLFNFTRKGKVIGFYLKASHNTFIEVFLTEKVDRGTSNQNLHHFCLEATDLAKSQTALLDRGYAPGEIKMGCDHSLQFWVVDPNGVDLEFHQYTDKSAQLTGADVEVDW